MERVFIKLIGLFVCIVVGFITYKKKMIDDSFNIGISKIVLNITLPCTIIISLQKEFSYDILQKCFIIFIVATFVHIFSIFLGFLFCKIFKVDVKDMGVVTFALTFANVSFLGAPVLMAVYGEEVVFFISFVIVVFNLLSFTLGLKILSFGYPSNKNVNYSLKTILKNIPILATLLGFILFLLQIELPEIIKEPLILLSGLTTPFAMILAGSILAKTNINDIFKNKILYYVAFLRLLAIPIFLKILLSNLINDKYIVNILCFIFGMPVATITVILAEDLKANTILASQLVFITSLFSNFTIPILIYFF